MNFETLYKIYTERLIPLTNSLLIYEYNKNKRKFILKADSKIKQQGEEVLTNIAKTDKIKIMTNKKQ